MIETPYSIRSEDRRGRVRVIDHNPKTSESIETTCKLLSEEQQELFSLVIKTIELKNIPPYTQIGVVEVTEDSGVMFNPFDGIKREFGTQT